MKIIKFIASIVICQLAGIIGSIFTGPSVKTWYPALVKPTFNPPSWVFTPVWTVLYVLMGISLYLVWNKENSKAKYSALAFFAVQLLLNALWSVLFFGLKSPLYALVEILLLWVAILFTIVKFSSLSKPAAYLLVPYIAWVSFAVVLNFFIFRLNY